MGNCSAKSCRESYSDDKLESATSLGNSVSMLEGDPAPVMIPYVKDPDSINMPSFDQVAAERCNFRERILQCVVESENLAQEHRALSTEVKLRTTQFNADPAMLTPLSNFSFRERLLDCAGEFERCEQEIRTLETQLLRLKQSIALQDQVIPAPLVPEAPEMETVEDLAVIEQTKLDSAGSFPSEQVDDLPPASKAISFNTEQRNSGVQNARFVGTMSQDFPDEEFDDGTPVVSAITGKQLTAFQIRQQRLAKWINLIVLENPVFKGAMVFSLVFALFGGGIWNLCNIPDDPGNVVLDAVMAVVMILFLAEVVLNCIADRRHYPMSFFFWMDVLGTGSMIFEISWLLGSAGEMNTADASVDTVLMRTARAAKVGARVGRLSKITKCLSMIYKSRNKKAGMQDGRVEAKALSTHLMLALSTKVSLLSIVLVLVVPLFNIGQYPESDLSMISWSERLEEDYRRAYDAAAADNSTGMFIDSVEKLKLFYADINYFPYKIEGYAEFLNVDGKEVFIPGQSELSFTDPVRKQNIIRQKVQTCAFERQDCEGETLASIYFDFKHPNQLEAGMDIVMIFFIIAVMILASFDLSQTLDIMLVKPLEGMLGVLRKMAMGFIEQLQFDEVDEDDEREEGMAELELLQIAFEKLVRLTNLLTDRKVLTREDMAGMADDHKGVLVELMNLEVEGHAQVRDKPSMRGNDSSSMSQSFVRAAVAVLPVPVETVDSWDLDVLSIDIDQLQQVALHIFFDSEVGVVSGRQYCKPEVFNSFHTSVRAGYSENPYHCYAHAIDVLHSVYRFLSLSRTTTWLSDVDHHALLVAALCHDLGHQGFTNPYLVETMHDMALRYNDKSPLENMHCANLFAICSNPDNNVFKALEGESRKRARKVCIAAILHTDNVHHFDMVKEISKIYEINSLTCDVQASTPNEIEPSYEAEVLQKDVVLWCELFLHMADISNPLKPFTICKAWAWRVLDEFFAQGDEEKRLGLPVGLLNDRDKINRPGSQHGFINFLVAPLITQAVRIFPWFHPLTTQMGQNLTQWRNLWVEDANPTPEDVAKRDAEVSNQRNVASDLQKRTIAATSSRKTMRGPTVVCRSQGLEI